MRYRHVIFIGVSIIAALCLLCGLIYYFNKDKCPVGTLRLCKNSTKCISQRDRCNDIRDCPNGEDELIENCFVSQVQWLWPYQPKRSNNCGNETIEVSGTCERKWCEVTCENVTDLPQSFSSNIIEIELIQSSLGNLSDNELSKYSKLQYLRLSNSSITGLEKRAFFYQTKLHLLDLSDNKISEILPGHLIGLKNLRVLLLNNNKIKTADFSDLENVTIPWIILNNNLLTTRNIKLPKLPALKTLMLDKNRLESITKDLFAGCSTLKELYMRHNNIINIEENAFQNLRQLRELDLAYNNIVTIPPNVFPPVNKLSELLISYNPIDKLSITLFNSLHNLHSLDVQGISIDHMSINAFGILPNLTSILFTKFYYCMTYAPNVPMCYIDDDDTSSLSQLFAKPLLRAAIWGISCTTCLSNSLVLLGRYKDDCIPSITIKNLAVSDMLMGIYLFTIAIEGELSSNDNNNKTIEEQIEESMTWMSTWFCTLLGALAMTSSEVSMLILIFISVERLVVITSMRMPVIGRYHKNKKWQFAISSMIIIWIVGLILAFTPVLFWRNTNMRFYGVNGMCFPLHIDDPYMIGWQYSAFVFLGLNFFGLMIIGYIYTVMFISIWKTRSSIASYTVSSSRDSDYALRFFLIVLTDATCWTPIVALKILALMKYPVSSDLQACIVIFIVPINSVINPLLYTFTTPEFRQRFKNCFGRVRSDTPMQHPMQNLQPSVITTNQTANINRSAIESSI